MKPHFGSEVDYMCVCVCLYVLVCLSVCMSVCRSVSQFTVACFAYCVRSLGRNLNRASVRKTRFLGAGLDLVLNFGGARSRIAGLSALKL